MRVIYKLGQAVLIVMVAASVLPLSACGQTGDLYLPEPEEQEEQQKRSN